MMMTQAESKPNYQVVLSTLTTLFFMWGFITCMNDRKCSISRCNFVYDTAEKCVHSPGKSLLKITCEYPASELNI